MTTERDDPEQPHRRRSSIAELFASRPLVDPSSAQGNNARPFQSPVATSVTQQAQQQSRTRRLSITTLGLSGSPSQQVHASPFGSFKRASVVSPAQGRSASHEFDESAIEDGNPAPLATSAPESSRSTGRRLSFGARAYGSFRSGAGGTDSSSDASSPAKGLSPHPTRAPEGFNWTDNLLSRARRTSISAMPGPSRGVNGTVPTSTTNQHNRPNTTVASQQAPPPHPAKISQTAPDHFQERILKGDFYMD